MDFTSPCPRGWEELGEDTCLAPLSYTGMCDMLLHIPSTWGLAQKKTWMHSCGGEDAVRWPCTDQCDPDASRDSCPVNWVELSDGLCDAPLSNGGPCSEMRVQRDIGGDDLKEFETYCGIADIPCPLRCTQNFTAACPDAWILVDGLCIAPSSYAGRPCLPFQNLAGLSEQDKEMWSTLCFAPFSCTNTPSTISEPIRICPDKWEQIGADENAYCRAPPDYKGRCRPGMPAAQIQRIGKQNFSSTCAASWERATDDARQHVSDDVSIPSVDGPIDSYGKLIGIHYVSA